MFYSEILFLAALQAGIVAVALIVPPRRALAERVLGGLLAVTGVELAGAGVLFSGQMHEWPHLLRITTPLAFLYGPLCYWFCAASVEPGYRLSTRSLWHLLPAVLVAGYFTPLYVAPAEMKLAYLDQLQQRPLSPESHVIGGLKRLQILGYIILSARALIPAVRLGARPFRAIAGALTLMALTLLWAGDVFDFLFDFGLGTRMDRVQMLGLAISVVLLTISALLRARVLPRETRGYSSPGIPESERAALTASLRQLFDEERIYLDPRLTLPALADRMATTPHQVSRLLNEHFGENFASFVNRHRVEEAMRMLECHSGPVLDVAFAAGFNSKSTFNTAFKRLVGVTPRQYRDRPQPGSVSSLKDGADL